MSKLQVLVATMNQTDLSLADKMNLHCDAVIANQADSYHYAQRRTEQSRIEMITTPTRGVGRNRNIALMAADAELYLFADDDIVYNDGSLSGVMEAFAELPQADVIIFSTDVEKNGVLTEKRHLPVMRRRIWNSLKFGTYAIGIRADALKRTGISFSTIFGGGCLYGSGEDTLFIRECFRKGLKVYSHSYLLGRRNKDGSSWFSGYNEKYFFDKGALFRTAFPVLYPLMSAYLALKMRNKASISCVGIYKQMLRGSRAVRTLRPYSDVSRSGS